jgi:hypothetical protein
MSHFTNIKTTFQNLIYLEKALNKLNIKNIRQEEKTYFNSTDSNNFNLVINQSNNCDIQFCWNGQEYELRVDRSFWEQAYTVESFIDKVSQQYASEVIIGESQKIGFQPIKYKTNLDGSNTIVLQRWNENN